MHDGDERPWRAARDWHEEGHGARVVAHDGEVASVDAAFDWLKEHVEELIRACCDGEREESGAAAATAHDDDAAAAARAYSRRDAVTGGHGDVADRQRRGSVIGHDEGVARRAIHRYHAEVHRGSGATGAHTFQIHRDAAACGHCQRGRIARSRDDDDSAVGLEDEALVGRAVIQV